MTGHNFLRYKKEPHFVIRTPIQRTSKWYHRGLSTQSDHRLQGIVIGFNVKVPQIEGYEYDDNKNDIYTWSPNDTHINPYTFCGLQH